jgi:Tetratricopeptide repeat.
MDLSNPEKPTVENKKPEAIAESPLSKPSLLASLPSDIPDVPKREVLKPSSYGTSQQELSIKPKLEEKVEISPKKEEKPSGEEKPSPSPSPSPKEEVISKPLILIQGSGKDHPLKTEVVQYFNKGVYHYQQGEVSKAIQAYQKAVDLDPAL